MKMKFEDCRAELKLEKKVRERLRKLSGIDLGTLDAVIPSNPRYIPGQLDFSATRKSTKNGAISTLIVECKAPGDQSSPGQDRALRDLSEIPLNTVWQVGLSGKQTSIGAWWFDPVWIVEYRLGKASIKEKCTLASTTEKYRRWYDAANQGIPFRD